MLRQQQNAELIFLRLFCCDCSSAGALPKKKNPKQFFLPLPSPEDTEPDFYAGHVHDLAFLSKQLSEGALFFICSPGLFLGQRLSPSVAL